MEAILRVRTQRFNLTEVKPHFINDCCFGEDFASWMWDQLQSLAAEGFELEPAPIQEDYGWGFWVRKGQDPYWISFCSPSGDRDEDAPGAPDPEDPDPEDWVVTVSYDPGLNIVKRLFHRPDTAGFERLGAAIRAALAEAPDIELLLDE